MKRVVDTRGHGISEGEVTQITLPNGKYMYTGIRFLNQAQKLGWECKTVKYFGACSYFTINERAHKKFPIQIDEVSIADFIDKVATDDECQQAIKENFEEVNIRILCVY